MTPPTPWVALAGNPNTGKTTLFNALTGLRGKVGNYPGVTIDRRSGPLRGATRPIEIEDVPGTYSLVARSAEEQVAIDALLGRAGEGAAPAAVVVCADATQLARSLYLLLQCQELGLPTVVALTMVDEAGAHAPSAGALAAVLDCEVVAVDARRGHGLPALVAAIERASTASVAPRWRWTPSASLRARLDQVAPLAGDDARALWALASLGGGDELVGIAPALRDAVAGAIPDEATGRAVDDEVATARWAWLDRVVAPLVVTAPSASRTERIDRVLLHRAGGLVAFAGVMFLLFMSLFAWADPAIGWVEATFAWVGEQVRAGLGEGIATDFLVDGVIAGVGSVVVFLPQLLLLFLFLGLLEDCGYLARVAYLMDRVMRSMNLHGRAFVPMLSGFACAVPAVAATRTLERRRDRLLTMMVVPLMSCSARLPVYTLLIAALIPASTTTQSLVMVGMYAFSTVTALIAAWVLSRLMPPLRAKRLPFVIELPPYRWPRLRDVLRMMWQKSSMFLREAGTVILACTIALWALLYFPRELPAGAADYPALIEAAPTAEAKTELESALAAVRIEHSYAGRLGHAIEPVLAPLGFDWKIGIGIIGAFAAREVFVATMGVVYGVGGEVDEGDPGLRAKLENERRPDGSAAYPPLVAVSLMLFFALAAQCMSTLAVVRRESGGYRWPAFLFAYMTGLAYVVSLVVYQVGRLLGAAG